jgi:hypothetical protein
MSHIGSGAYAGDLGHSDLELADWTLASLEGCARLSHAPTEHEHADAVQPGDEAVDDDRDGDGREDEGPQDRAEVCQPVPERQIETVRVGKTATQIMRASSCLLGGRRGSVASCAGRGVRWTW